MSTESFHGYFKSSQETLPTPSKELTKMVELMNYPLPANFATFTDEDLETYIETIYKKEHGMG